MSTINNLSMAIATSLFLAVPVFSSQTEVAAQSLLPSAARYVAQQSQSSALMMIQLPQLEVSLEQSSEIMGQLAIPLQLEGQTIPAGAMVRIFVVPTEDDAYLEADTIILPDTGATISISAKGSVIAGEKIVDRRGEDAAKEKTAIAGNVGQNLVLAAGGNADEAIQGGSGAGVLGTIIGLDSGSSRKVVRLTQGVYSLDLD